MNIQTASFVKLEDFLNSIRDQITVDAYNFASNVFYGTTDYENSEEFGIVTFVGACKPKNTLIEPSDLKAALLSDDSRCHIDDWNIFEKAINSLPKGCLIDLG
jgi:hypothetical protein